MERRVFVTVGTTKFDDLIQTVQSLEIRAELRDLSFTKLQVQYGRGSIPCFEGESGLQEEIFDFKPSILPYFNAASLVISHGGSGSILESLRAGKQLIVVINRSLMHDHQTELAKQLSKDNYLIYTDCDGLLDTLRKRQWEKLTPFPEPPEINPFMQEMDKFLGFS